MAPLHIWLRIWQIFYNLSSLSFAHQGFCAYFSCLSAQKIQNMANILRWGPLGFCWKIFCSKTLSPKHHETSEDTAYFPSSPASSTSPVLMKCLIWRRGLEFEILVCHTSSLATKSSLGFYFTQERPWWILSPWPNSSLTRFLWALF